MAAVSAAGVTGLTAACGVDLGPQRTQDREVAGVTAVELAGDGDLTIASAALPSLSVTAPESLLDRLTSDVDAGTLVLGRARGAWWVPGGARYLLEVDEALRSVVVTGSGDVIAADVTGRDVEITVSGSGDVLLAGVDADRVTITVTGSGDVEVSGTADQMSVTVQGSGEVRATTLTAAEATVEVAGSGDVGLRATGTLDARVSGSGTVTYSGRPTVTSDVSGSGDVRQADA